MNHTQYYSTLWDNHGWWRIEMSAHLFQTLHTMIVTGTSRATRTTTLSTGTNTHTSSTSSLSLSSTASAVTTDEECIVVRNGYVTVNL